MQKNKFISSISCLVLISFIILPVYAEDAIYVWSQIEENSISNANQLNNQTEETSSSILNQENIDENNSLNLESESAILIEQNSGQILYSHNSHEQLRPASVTKIMSILLIMEQIDNGKLSLTDEIECSETASSMGGSQIWLDQRETLTVDEMLKAICVVSANDCVMAMAEHIAGSEESFVKMMNDKATELGMKDTCFKNCHGIDEDEHVTSSYDIALMSRELLTKYPEITKYTTIWMDSLRDGKSELVNTNKLVRNYQGATGLKTGSTSLALYNLSASATRDGLSLIAVIMKGPTSKIRFSEAEKLLNYGFSNFQYEEFAKQGDILKQVNVSKGTETILNVQYSTNAGALIEKGTDKEIIQNINIQETIEAPVTKGQKIGEITYVMNDETLTTVEIVAQNDVEKINIISMSKEIISKWFNLLRAV